MSFAELALARGISTASAHRLVRRRRWRKQTDNEGHVRVLVPVENGQRPTDSLADNVRQLGGLIAVFRDLVGQTERTRQVEAALAEARQEITRLETVLAQFRFRADVAEAQEAAAALLQAEADRRTLGRWARLRAAWRGE